MLQGLPFKEELKSLDPTQLYFPEGTRVFINQSLSIVTSGASVKT